MVRSEAARRRGSSGGDVIDLVMRARALANDITRRENAASAVELFRKALDLDPDNVDALVGVATLSSYQVLNLYRLGGRDALLEEAEAFLAPRRSLPSIPACSRRVRFSTGLTAGCRGYHRDRDGNRPQSGSRLPTRRWD